MARKIDCCYPEKITWILNLENVKSPLDPFGKKTQKKIKSAFNKLTSSEYSFKVEQADAHFIAKFFPLYEESLRYKKNPIIHDLMDKVVTHPVHEFPYFALSLYQKEELKGGVIFSDRGNSIVTAFRAFPEKINIPLPIGISYLAEYQLNNFAIENNKNCIQRGSDRNLFGVNSSLGLVNFKLLCGYKPYILSKTDTEKRKSQIFDGYQWDERQNVLIFEFSEFGSKIEDAILLVSDVNQGEIMEKCKALFNTDFLKLRIIHRESQLC